MPTITVYKSNFICYDLNPLKHGRFLDFFFFFIGASATKRFARPRICRYGLPQHILSKRQKAREGAPPPREVRGYSAKQIWNE